MIMNAQRHAENPLIHPGMDTRLGANINGPSLIRVPECIDRPLGRYYLYFAHHEGRFIRMAYGDAVTGPYTVYSPGVLALEDTPFREHIASPDVHVDPEAEKIVMHYHGYPCALPPTLPYGQLTCYAESGDGQHFLSDQLYLAESCLRTFFLNGWYYGFSGGGRRFFSRSRDWRAPFCRGPVLEIAGEEGIALAVLD